MSIMIIPSPKTAVRSHVEPVNLLRNLRLFWAVCLGILLAPNLARAAFHLWNVNEVYSSGDGSVQFIELQEVSDGYGGNGGLGSYGATLRSTNAAGVNVFTFPTDLTGDTADKTLILGTANLASIPGGVTPDYIIPPNFIRPPVAGANAAVIFDPYPDVAVYTNLPTDGVASLVRLGSSVVFSSINSPKNFKNDFNSIVPVKLQSITNSRNDFILSFTTAKGTNGTAGPNYAVEFKDAVNSTNWQTLANVVGNGIE